MPALLVSLDGRADLTIDRVLIVVGRHHGCDARLISRRVSRRHCCLALERDGVLVRDLGSTNGTWINGRRIETGLLQPGNELAIAHLRFRLEVAEATEVASAPEDRRASGPEASARPGNGEVTRSAELP